MSGVFRGRRANWAFGLGCLAVTAGVLLHMPMFADAQGMGYRMAGMAMDANMLWGMALIVAGVAIAGYGLLPARRDAAADAAAVVVGAAEDAPLGTAHWLLMVVLTVALVIDVMKPASLGFTVPGMIAEYGVPKRTVSLVPFFALAGTVVGSVVWGALADLYGRKASILLSAVMFVGTSICGAMPSLAWNIAMCFMMGAAAGGMLPVTYALLAETMPNRHRGWALVLVGGLGAVGGYFAASGASAILQPLFGWRVLWLMNLPTGLLLIALGGFIPESARFLLAQGRDAEAAVVLRRFGAIARAAVPASVQTMPDDTRSTGRLIALSVAALAWGLVNFGLLLWLPAELVARGFSVGGSSRLLAQSALIAFPTVFIAAALYSRWSTKWSLALSIGVTLAGLASVLLLGSGDISPILPVALLLVGSNALLAILLPYAAESFPLRVRARATGLVAAFTKAGGLLAQALTIAGLTPTIGHGAALIALPALAALALVARYGRETRGRDLQELDAPRVRSPSDRP
ncbi:MAG TPA: MFS transporter [Sphingomonas sp.]|jgi:putative MFS transporter|nr:MFS transporter [Sphingomonas sp.]